MKHSELRREVCLLNRRIVDSGLSMLTWGNASIVDRASGCFGIKPSGVAYDDLTEDSIVVLSIETGDKIEGPLRPSSDTPTHLELYRSIPGLGAIVHTHSPWATIWAQARMEIPCFGTTHADHFFGPIPVTREMHPDEIRNDYEHNTGRVIIEKFSSDGINPLEVPAVLVASHGPFVWGKNGNEALDNAVVLEQVAKMALQTGRLNPDAGPLSEALLSKHFLRKHGKSAYYGQPDEQ